MSLPNPVLLTQKLQEDTATPALGDKTVMSGLQHINLRVEPIATDSTGNVTPILHQIRHALEQLLQHNQTTYIDLQHLPLTDADLQSLQTTLGIGEISAQLNSLGRSHIWETQYAGVWCIEHYDGNDNRISQHLEITWLPSLLQSQPEDVRASMDNLRQHLS